MITRLLKPEGEPTEKHSAPPLSTGGLEPLGSGLRKLEKAWTGSPDLLREHSLANTWMSGQREPPPDLRLPGM